MLHTAKAGGSCSCTVGWSGRSTVVGHCWRPGFWYDVGHHTLDAGFAHAPCTAARAWAASCWGPCWGGSGRIDATARRSVGRQRAAVRRPGWGWRRRCGGGGRPGPPAACMLPAMFGGMSLAMVVCEGSITRERAMGGLGASGSMFGAELGEVHHVGGPMCVAMGGAYPRHFAEKLHAVVRCTSNQIEERGVCVCV